MEKEMATHSSILAWRIQWTGKPGGLLSMESQRVGHDWSNLACMHALEKEMATYSSVLAWRIPGTGEPGGLLPMGSHRVGHDWSDLAAAAWCPSPWRLMNLDGFFIAILPQKVMKDRSLVLPVLSVTLYQAILFLTVSPPPNCLLEHRQLTPTPLLLCMPLNYSLLSDPTHPSRVILNTSPLGDLPSYSSPHW